MKIIEQCRIGNLILALRGYGVFFNDIFEFYVVEVTCEREKGIFHIVNSLTRRYKTGQSLDTKKNKAFSYYYALKERFLGNEQN